MAATPERIREAELVSLAFHQALVAQGVRAAAETLVLWQDVPAQPGIPGWDAWMSMFTIRFRTNRTAAVRLAKAYYNLVRALITDHTLAGDGTEQGEVVPINVLRDAFIDEAGFDYRDAQVAETEDLPTAASMSDPETDDDPLDIILEQDDEEEIAVDDGDDDDEVDEDEALDQAVAELIAGLDEEEERIERAAEEELQEVLDTLGRELLERKMSESRAETPEESDQDRAEAHRAAGNRVAASTSRQVQNGARSAVFERLERDRRAIGYIRVSRTGTPCGWCAMLISRGPVYKTEERASNSKTSKGRYSGTTSYEDGDKYHDNCYCYALPVFSEAQWEQGEMFGLNRQYAEEWPRVTRGLSGKAAVSAWRRHIR